MAEQTTMKWFERGFGELAGKAKVEASLYEASELKSGLQKYIRRGEIEKAVRTADEMLRCGAEKPLLRRLPAIVAEDCGWRKLWTVKACSAVRWGERAILPPDRKDLLRVVAKLAYGPKDKDASALADYVREHLKTLPELPPDDLQLEDFAKAVAAKDEVRATQLLLHWAGRKEGKSFHKEPFWAVLEKATVERGLPHVAETLLAIKQRTGYGFYFAGDGVGLAVCALYAAIREEGWDEDFPQELADIVQRCIDHPMQVKLDWYCLDMHTAIGKIVLGSLVKRKGWDKDRLENWWFYFESARLNDHVVAKYFDHWAANVKNESGQSLTEAHKEWEQTFRPEVESFTKWLMDRRKKL